MKSQIQILKKLWKNYKYRFTPWIALNLAKEAKKSQEVSTLDFKEISK